jgi:hypothetical protein
MSFYNVILATLKDIRPTDWNSHPDELVSGSSSSASSSGFEGFQCRQYVYWMSGSRALLTMNEAFRLPINVAQGRCASSTGMSVVNMFSQIPGSPLPHFSFPAALSVFFYVYFLTSPTIEISARLLSSLRVVQSNLLPSPLLRFTHIHRHSRLLFPPTP